MVHLRLLLSSLALACRAFGAQWPLTGNLHEPTSFDGFSPVGALRSSVSVDGFTTFGHPLFPRYSARIKRLENWCDEQVGAYTGYIDIQARHIFFYFFESKNNSDTDPVVLWTNGGPGSSSSLGLFNELGPCRITNATAEPVPFKEAWNANANVFFLDQPVGVGFSYADYGESVSTTEEASIDIARFMFLFFENFPQFKGRDLHLSGESYGGRYLPLFGAAIYDQNAELTEAGLEPINLSSIMIGNGMTDSHLMFPGWYEYACTHHMPNATPFLDIETCVRMKKSVPRCAKLLKEHCEDTLDTMNCEHAFAFCSSEISAPVEALDINPYNIAKPCSNAPDCYTEQAAIAAYLSRSDVRQMLGVDDAVPPPYQGHSEKVNYAFVVEGTDLQRTTTAYVAALLERGVRVLIYVGKNDWVCNYLGNSKWISLLDWTGGDAFNQAETRNWEVGGKVAGETRSSGLLTWVTIDDAGHLVPYDQPKTALAMVNRWLGYQSI
ncbi:serine carboxypeptidase [Peniophora sp. CONT]|nr:serine carboxypeptidase [Peniophora sp. CONT]